MSRTYAAVAPSSSPESATILALALPSCSPVGSGTGAATISHSPSIAAGSMYLRLDQLCLVKSLFRKGTAVGILDQIHPMRLAPNPFGTAWGSCNPGRS